jgi:thiol-disulfide isomerase/thioredoxin
MSAQPGVLGCAVMLLVLGCDESKKPPPETGAARSQAVLAAPGASSAVAKLAQAEPAKPPADEGPLCSPAEVVDLPKAAISGLGTSASPFAGGPLPVGRATWITLWAAWCEPCKKELPLLLEWKQKLAAEGKPFELVFLSLDDDERQLGAFLAQHPELGSSYWLREGEEREKFMTALGLSTDPRLPVQLLVSRAGAVSCRIEGAVEAGDYARVKDVVARL